MMDLAESHLRTFEYLINEESKNIKFILKEKEISVLELIKILRENGSLYFCSREMILLYRCR